MKRCDPPPPTNLENPPKGTRELKNIKKTKYHENFPQNSKTEKYE